MDKGKGTAGQPKVESLAESQEQAQELAEKAGLPYAELREDGAVVFGDSCVVIKPTPEGKLGITIEPSRCGQLQGQALLKYLIETAGKGVVIEIPAEEPTIKVKPGKVTTMEGVVQRVSEVK